MTLTRAALLAMTLGLAIVPAVRAETAPPGTIPGTYDRSTGRFVADSPQPAAAATTSGVARAEITLKYGPDVPKDASVTCQLGVTLVVEGVPQGGERTDSESFGANRAYEVLQIPYLFPLKKSEGTVLIKVQCFVESGDALNANYSESAQVEIDLKAGDNGFTTVQPVISL